MARGPVLGACAPGGGRNGSQDGGSRERLSGTLNDVGHLVWVSMGSHMKDSFFNLQDSIEIKISVPQAANLEGWPLQGAENLPFLLSDLDPLVLGSVEDFFPIIYS